MENSYYHSRKIRKPNKKIWVCPFCWQDTNTMNTRGAPAHLRNKHGLSWKKEYLEKPELLFNDRALSANHEHFMQFKELFPDIEIKNKPLVVTMIINQIYFLIKSTRKALKENDYSRLEEIYKMLPSNRVKNK